MLALEVDGHPLQSDFAQGYYIPQNAKWLRVSTRVSGYDNICRGVIRCVDRLRNDDCSKIPFTLIDAKRRNEYPSLGNQLDAMWKGPSSNAYTEMHNLIESIKNKYPKE